MQNSAKRKMEEKETQAVKSWKNGYHGETSSGDKSKASYKMCSSSESDDEPTWSEQGAWREEDVRAYLVSPFAAKELIRLRKCQSLAISGQSVGRDKIPGKSLAPLLMIPPGDIDLANARNYYIDDTVMNRFFILLQRRYERFPHKYVKHHSFDSFIATFLINEKRTESQVLSWVKKEELKGVRKLFLPMCLHEHWILFYVDIDDKKLLWLDSNEHSRMFNVLEKAAIQHWFLKFLLPYLEYDPKDWLFDSPKDIPLQKNSIDCALFVMKYADCLTHNNIKGHQLHALFTQDDMPHF